MDILTTKLPTFEQIVINFLKNGKTTVLEQLRNLLEQIDNELCSSRPKTLKIIKFKERSILTDFGMLTFKRRYYYDTMQDVYTCLLDTYLKIPKRSKVMTNIKLRIIEACSEMSYSKASRYGAPNGYPLSKSTAYRYIRDVSIRVKENNYITMNNDTIHVQIDEKFMNMIGSKNKKKHITATIFKGRKQIGKKGRIKLLNRTLLSAKNEEIIYKKINAYLFNKYRVKPDDLIYVSGDLAKYIQTAPEKILVCKSKYVPDKFHIKQALIDEVGVYATDNDLSDSKFIEALVDGLKNTVTTNGKKLKNILKKNSDSLKTYIDTNYQGCSQEGMNSHYYASRFAKLPMKMGIKNLTKLSKIIEAKENNSLVTVGFEHEYYLKPYDIVGHMPILHEERFVLDTRCMDKLTRKMFEHLKYGC